MTYCSRCVRFYQQAVNRHHGRTNRMLPPLLSWEWLPTRMCSTSSLLAFPLGAVLRRPASAPAGVQAELRLLQQERWAGEARRRAPCAADADLHTKEDRRQGRRQGVQARAACNAQRWWKGERGSRPALLPESRTTRVGRQSISRCQMFLRTGRYQWQVISCLHQCGYGTIYI